MSRANARLACRAGAPMRAAPSLRGGVKNSFKKRLHEA
ncbi:hypothetical protein BMAJHU_F0593 [Burkholderia mallei JHU]|uniref:Uncharacterized protein n=1 Tax=Burkholderia mallei (strain NCTC 10229) TaxID=412022 RepID=A2RVW5_BURM9|nr:hypothetical protein BMA10229_0002 [Burkholderia mallei NCTC 10229]EDK57557.1 hypothetical protein BMAJHU_F0593 [Burkholderia mallei JHU]